MNTQSALTKATNGPAKAGVAPDHATDANRISERPHQGSAEILVAARRWYETELERCARAHGVRWPEHCAWVESYLREELRRRLAARGWRLAHVVV